MSYLQGPLMTFEDIAQVRQHKNAFTNRPCRADECYEVIETDEIYNIVKFTNGSKKAFHLECLGAQFGKLDFEFPNFVRYGR